jgi:hypothetical protein
VVLSGTLHEFILADVFQLLAQQKATGKLLLTYGSRSGFLILRRGDIIAAEEEEECLRTKLVNWLVDARKVSRKEIDMAVSSCGNNLGEFVAALTSREYLTVPEATAFAQATIGDLSCSLFSWSKGDYRFDSLYNVDEYAVPNVVLPADFAVMEAMRRTDEAKAVFEHVQDNTIFVPSEARAGPGEFSSDLIALVENPDRYVLSFVDGLSTVGAIVRRTCLCRYRVYEALYTLWKEGRIAPLSSKLSRSIEAAISQEEGLQLPAHVQWASSMCLGVAAVAVMVLLGVYGFREVLLGERAEASRRARMAVTATQRQRKSEIAKAHYHALVGSMPTNLAGPIEAGLLTSRDLVTPLERLQWSLRTGMAGR